MNPKQLLNLLSSAAWFGILGLLVAGVQPVVAQNVVGVSAILSDSNSAEIYTYSATELDYYAWSWYDPDVQAGIYDVTSGTWVRQIDSSPGANQAPGPDNAMGIDSYAYAFVNLTQAVHQPDTYILVSYHYLWTLPTLVNGYYYDPYGYDPGSQFLPGDPATGGGTFVGSGQPEYLPSQEIYIGYTAIELATAAPTITSINPTGAVLGTTDGKLVVQGTNLLDVFTRQTTPYMKGATGSLTPGFSFNLANSTFTSPSEVTLDYSINSTTAAAGAQNLTLTTAFGSSSPVTFTIGDPQPSIASVSPSTWSAGTNQPITITGTGFGTNPSITIIGAGINCSGATMSTPQAGCSISAASDNSTAASITASVTLAASAHGTATISVQSNGYNGSGFVQVNPGAPATSPTATVQISSMAAPVPQIMFNGQNVAGTTAANPVQVVSGQQIALSAVVPGLSGDLFVQTQGWTFPQGSVVGGYNASTASGCTVPLPLQSLPSDCSGQSPQSLTSANFTYYWVDTGNSRTMTYSYTLNNGNSNSATATFNVAGPTNPSVTVQAGYAGVWSTNSGASQVLGFAGLAAPPEITGGGSDGIILLALQPPPSWPAGSYSWVQVLQYDKSTVLQPSGPYTGYSLAPIGPMLDNYYPYPARNRNVGSDLAVDAPNIGLCTKWGEAARNFSAKMYLMWTPGVGAGCSGTACTIPIPLGSIAWQWSADVINTLSPQNTASDGTQANGWVRQSCTAPSAPNSYNPQFVQSNAYPTWASAAQNIKNIACPQ